MRNKFILTSIILINFFLNINAQAEVYEASTLHNSVSRSETVMDLFFKRWDTIQERELYCDIYGKINWVPGFQIKSINKGTGERMAVDMRLVRSYGSISLNYPIIGGYKGKNIKERMANRKATENKNADNETDIEDKENLNATIIQGDSREVEFEEEIDLLFIDGDHHYATVKADIEHWVPKCKGILAFHDYNPTAHNLRQFPELEGVKRAVNEWFATQVGWTELPAPDSLRIFKWQK